MRQEAQLQKPAGAPCKEEDPEGGEGDFPENCLFRLVHNYAHRMARGRKEKDGRRTHASKSQEAISYANRGLTETGGEVFKEALARSGRRRTKRWSWERAKKSYLSLFLLLSFRGFLGGLLPSVSLVRTHFCSYC